MTRHWAGAAELSCVCGGLPKYRLGSSRWKLSVESSEADELDLYMDLFEESSLRTLLGTAACRLVLAVARARSHQQATQRAAQGGGGEGRQVNSAEWLVDLPDTLDLL